MHLLKVFANRRMFTVFILGFSSGLPLMLTGGGSTMQAWLKDGNVDLATIGRFSLVGLPYALKFLWAPFLDSFAAPGFAKFGRRRGWAFLSQLCLIASLAALSMTNPATGLVAFTAVAVAVAFFSASQDIVLDALRTEIIHDDEVGPGGSLYTTGYRAAMLVSGAVALAASKVFSWQIIYLAMAAIQTIGIAMVFWTAEPKTAPKKYVSFKDRVLDPFAEFFKRPSAMEILAFVMLYKLPTLMATALTTVFLLDLGFDRTEIAAVAKFAGLVATIVGTLAGGALMVKTGLRSALWIFGVLQALGGGLFIVLAQLGKNYVAMTSVVIADNFLLGMGTAAIVGFMMSVCSKQFTGTQFALLSSLTAFTRVILIAPAGALAKAMGWSGFFVFSITLAAPGLLLLLRFKEWTKPMPASSGAAKLSKLDLFVMASFLLSLIVISTDFVWPKIGLPDIGLWVGAAGLGTSLLGWGAKALRRT
ncbi:MAG: MFS transporter [Bdellovibrionales bacterium]|nr:MFS transporter [Bdellovibrionales bacterium]